MINYSVCDFVFIHVTIVIQIYMRPVFLATLVHGAVIDR